MDWRVWRIAAGIAWMTLASAAYAGPLIVVDLPDGGNLGDVARPALRTLRSNGYEIVRLGIDDFDEKADIAAFCFGSSSELRRQIGDDIAKAVKGGAGLVYLAGTTRGELRDDAEFLGGLELTVNGASSRTSDARITRHRITQGLDAPRLQGPPIPYEILGRSHNALLRQDERAIAVASEFVKGRVVVWPAEMLSSPADDAQHSVRAELLARSMAWAAGSNEPEKAYAGAQSPSQPETGTTNGAPASSDQRARYKQEKADQGSVPAGPAQPADFRGDEPLRDPTLPDAPVPPAANLPSLPSTISATAIIDIAGTDDDWPRLSSTVEGIITRAGLSTRAIEFRPDVTPEPLVRYLPTTPSLLVIGSHRDFSYAEARAVANHVRAGGALLVLAHARPDSQLRMVQINRILSEFGLAAKLSRPEGRAVVIEQPLTDGINLLDVGKGIGIWGFGDWELVTVQGESIASVMLADGGRVFVCDGGRLISDDQREAGEFEQLVSQALQWLTGTR